MRRNVFALVVTIFALLLPACSPPMPDYLVWAFQTPRPFLAGNSQAYTPVVTQDLIFFCGGYAWNDASGLFALGTNDGLFRWKKNVGKCNAAPALLGATLVVVADERHGEMLVLYGLDPGSGREQWKITLPNHPIYHVTLAISDQFVYMATANGEVLRINAADGSAQSFTLPGRPSNSDQAVWITATKGIVYFGFGKVTWRWHPGETHPQVGAHLSRLAGRPNSVGAADRILFLGEREDAGVRAFELETGREIWLRFYSRVLSMPLLADGVVLVNVWKPRFSLRALDLHSGRELWSVNDGSFQPPSASGDLIVAAGERAVYVLDSQTGRVLATVRSPAEVLTTPIVVGDTVLFATAQGALYRARLPLQEN